MVVQDLTKFTVVLVILGIILAIAIFRPQVFPSSPVEPTEEMQQDGVTNVASNLEPAGSGGGTLSYEDLLTWQEELESRQGALSQRQAALNERKAALDQRQAALDEHEAGLNERQMELDQLKAELNQRQVELEGRKAELKKQMASLQADEARLRRWEVDLAELEQKLEGRLRVSVVAAIASGLLAVPSVMLVVALLRQGRGRPDTTVERTQALQGHQRQQIARHGGLVAAASTSICGSDGRGKQSVGHCV